MVILFRGVTSGKEPTCECRRCKKCRFKPWIRKIPWRRAWQPITVFSPGESRGQRSLPGYGSQGLKELGTIEATQQTLMLGNSVSSFEELADCFLKQLWHFIFLLAVYEGSISLYNCYIFFSLTFLFQLCQCLQNGISLWF